MSGERHMNPPGSRLSGNYGMRGRGDSGPFRGSYRPPAPGVPRGPGPMKPALLPTPGQPQLTPQGPPPRSHGGALLPPPPRGHGVLRPPHPGASLPLPPPQGYPVNVSPRGPGPYNAQGPPPSSMGRGGPPHGPYGRGDGRGGGGGGGRGMGRGTPWMETQAGRTHVPPTAGGFNPQQAGMPGPPHDAGGARGDGNWSGSRDQWDAQPRRGEFEQSDDPGRYQNQRYGADRGDPETAYPCATDPDGPSRPYGGQYPDSQPGSRQQFDDRRPPYGDRSGATAAEEEWRNSPPARRAGAEDRPRFDSERDAGGAYQGQREQDSWDRNRSRSERSGASQSRQGGRSPREGEGSPREHVSRADRSRRGSDQASPAKRRWQETGDSSEDFKRARHDGSEGRWSRGREARREESRERPYKREWSRSRHGSRERDPQEGRDRKPDGWGRDSNPRSRDSGTRDRDADDRGRDPGSRRKRESPNRPSASGERSSSRSRHELDSRKHRESPKYPSSDFTSLEGASSSPFDPDKDEPDESLGSYLSSALLLDPEEVMSDPEDPGKAQDKAADEEDEERLDVPAWTRSSPADLYFRRNHETGEIQRTENMKDIEDKFEGDLMRRAAKVRQTKPTVEKPSRTPATQLLSWRKGEEEDPDSSDGSESSSEEEDFGEITWADELARKKNHPERLHEELWFNEPMEMNDGPLCHCSQKARKTGIRHNIYPGEESSPQCDAASNNSKSLHHYRITMSPHTNFLTKNPTVIEYDNHEYIFEGFSLFSHYKLEKIPVCKVIRFNIEYTIHWFEEDMPENFSTRSLDLFSRFLFYELLELYDLDWLGSNTTCAKFHLMPRFVRNLPDNGRELLSMNTVLNYLLKNSKPLIDASELPKCQKYSVRQWQNFVDQVRGMIVTYPGMRPSSLRIDQLDRDVDNPVPQGEPLKYPKIIHFGVRPAQLSYAGDPTYQTVWKEYMKLKHLLANKPKVITKDKEDLKKKEELLQDIRLKGSMKREVTVEISSQGYVRTGVRSDICQHALLLPVLIMHLRFHKCLEVLEGILEYKFQDPYLLQLATTHPSYRTNYGTNPDHSRNSLSNCGMRQLEYGDRKVHIVHTRKRGINTLIHIMAKMGRRDETASEINHYERLEFLGDAVVEFLSSVHLFYMFPNLAEGGLATYRAAIVQNQHLTVLAKKLRLQEFMLYGHGPDLCQDYSLRHAMANCFEALMGALLIDGGVHVADRIFGKTLFGENPALYSVYVKMAHHPLQEDEPNGDRHWIASSPILQKLLKFEDETGITFRNIRLLARAFTMRNVAFNNLTLGHNQRMEFLGDTILQFICSEYLFKHFPDHHEGHLSLLRSSLVNNRTQAVVCDDLGLTDFIINSNPRLPDRIEIKMKEKADLVEAFFGALYIDKDLVFCEKFCHVCFFPRLKKFIMNQDWNDPKSQLQQCCLTLRDLHDEDPDIPIYKVLQSTGPTNTRKYTVAVYFRGERLAVGVGHSIQQAEMDAASHALSKKASLFPHLIYQKAFLARKFKRFKKKKSGEGDGDGDDDGESLYMGAEDGEGGDGGSSAQGVKAPDDKDSSSVKQRSFRESGSHRNSPRDSTSSSYPRSGSRDSGYFSRRPRESSSSSTSRRSGSDSGYSRDSRGRGRDYGAGGGGGGDGSRRSYDPRASRGRRDHSRDFR